MNPEGDTVTSLTCPDSDLEKVLNFILNNDDTDVTEVCEGLRWDRDRVIRAVNWLSARGKIRKGKRWNL